MPLHLRPAPTKLMEQLGHGKDYKYPHDHAGGYVVEQYLPDLLKDRNYYVPKQLGAEAAIKSRLDARKKP